MNIRDLKLFLHLADSCHFGRTANAMHISPSTLSRQIQRLEESFGHILFMRDNRTVRLTEAGKQFKQFAQQTLFEYQQIRHSLNQQSALLTGELRLFCSVTAAYSHLPKLLDNFRLENPLIKIKLTTGDAADAVNKVASQAADLAIAGKPEKLPDNILFNKLGEIPLVLIAPSLAGTIRQQITQPQPNWQQIPFILQEHGPARQRIALWFQHQAINNPLIYATVSGHEAIVSMVALGCGIALIPKVVVDNSPESIRHRILQLDPISPVEPFDLGVCVLNKRLNEPLIRAFWQLLTVANMRSQ